MAKRRRSNSSSSSSECSTTSSSEDEKIKKRPIENSSSSDEEDDWNDRTSSKKKQKKTVNKPAKKQSKPIIKESEESSADDEKEEGEVDDDDDEFNDGYDENLMGDEEDQQRLSMMTEKEREQELFNRSEKREVLKTRFEIEKKLRLAKKKEQNNKITFSEFRSTDRRKALENNKKQTDGLKQLKELREKQKQKAKLKASDVYSSDSDSSDNERNQRRKSSSGSDSSSEESSDDERRRKSDDDFNNKDIEEQSFTLDHRMLNSIRLSRFKLSQWCHTPFFKETVVGCFVRLSIGQNKDKIQVYRVAEIVDVSDGNIAYELEKTKTAKVIKLKYGRDERNFRIAFVSNTEITEYEFNEWKTRLDKDHINLPTKKQIDDKIKSINEAVNYNFKESDVDAIVKEKEKYEQQPVNFAMKKTQLMKEKDMAEQRGDHIKMEEIAHQLEELEEKAKELDYKRTQNISAISYINERNRLRNIVDAEKAIVAARESDKLNKGDEPFKRRKCAPMLVSMTKNKLQQTNVKEENKDVVDTATNGKQQSNGKTSQLNNKKDDKNEIEQNDLFSAHDFDIQIDFDITSNLTSTSNNSISNSIYSNNQSTNSLNSTNKSTNRRSLNLEEYKKKKGLI